MTQISRPQPDLNTTYPDAGPYSADQWGDLLQALHNGDNKDIGGVLPTYLNLLGVTTDGTSITIASGAALVNGHLLLNDATVTITPTAPGAPATYTVVAVQNNTNVVYNTNLDTVAPYAGGVPAYATRLAVLRTNVLVQTGSYWEIPLATFSIDGAGAITSLTEARQFCGTEYIVSVLTNTLVGDVLHIGTFSQSTAGAVGLGAAIKAWLENAASVLLSAGKLAWRWSVATAGAERSRIEVRSKYQTTEVLNGVIEGPATASADGNTRGIGSVDWQGYRSGVTQVASGNYATLSGGKENISSGVESVVSGGDTNTASGANSSVGGGNNNLASNAAATISGGNSSTASGQESTVGGGNGNVASGTASTACGGRLNTASGDNAVVAGGDQSTASGTRSAVGGGGDNLASGQYATIPGGLSNSAVGDYSNAWGRRAKANHQGATVIADSENADFASDRANQFKVRASGNSHFRQNDPAAAQPVMELSQADQDEAFLNYIGTSAADQTKSISTVNGDGVVTGPKDYASTAGWAFVGMVKIQVNGVAFWVPYYQPDLS